MRLAALCLFIVSLSGTPEYDRCMRDCSGSHSDCQARCQRYLTPRVW